MIQLLIKLQSLMRGYMFRCNFRPGTFKDITVKLLEDSEYEYSTFIEVDRCQLVSLVIIFRQKKI